MNFHELRGDGKDMEREDLSEVKDGKVERMAMRVEGRGRREIDVSRCFLLSYGRIGLFWVKESIGRDVKGDVCDKLASEYSRVLGI